MPELLYISISFIVGVGQIIYLPSSLNTPIIFTV
nr:MAG TPA: hypothetical protein [Caudoviricetes sp.]